MILLRDLITEPCNCACLNLAPLRFQLINASRVKVVALRSRVFLRLVAEMCDWFLAQRIDIKFCVKLGKNANYCGAIPSEAYGREPVKISKCF
jgi:hypothetical protein